MFKTCLLGPDEIKEPARYSKAIPKEAYPDLRKEALHFQVNPFDKSPLTIDTLLNFVHFDEVGRVGYVKRHAVRQLGREAGRRAPQLWRLSEGEKGMR